MKVQRRNAKCLAVACAFFMISILCFKQNNISVTRRENVNTSYHPVSLSVDNQIETSTSVPNVNSRRTSDMNETVRRHLKLPRLVDKWDISNEEDRQYSWKIWWERMSGNIPWPDGGDVTGLNRRLPNALIIGEMKCGTTALMTFLNFHPDIVIPQKEINFFSLYYNKGFNWYRSQMPLATPDQLVMEKSVYFMGRNRCYKRIHAYNPNIKMILILRDPVDRTISHFSMKKRNREEYRNTTLEKHVLGPGGTLRTRHEFIRRSNYYKSMLNWIKYFSLNQIDIIDGDDFVKNPLEYLTNVEKHLGIRPFFSADNIQYNEKKGFYCYIADDSTTCLPPDKGFSEHAPVTPELKQKLVNYFAPYNKRLFELIGREFSWQR